jgi:hypothetical protein
MIDVSERSLCFGRHVKLVSGAIIRWEVVNTHLHWVHVDMATQCSGESGVDWP